MPPRFGETPPSLGLLSSTNHVSIPGQTVVFLAPPDLQLELHAWQQEASDPT